MDYTIQLALSVTNTNGTLQISVPVTTTTAAGTDAIAGTQTIGTSSEQLNLGDLATAAFVVVVNTDATNYVEVDAADTYDKFPQKILPGKAIVICPQTVTLHARANTAPVAIQLLACEL